MKFVWPTLYRCVIEIFDKLAERSVVCDVVT